MKEFIYSSSKALDNYLNSDEDIKLLDANPRDTNIFFFKPAGILETDLKKLKQILNHNTISLDDDIRNEVIELFLYYFEVFQLRNNYNSDCDYRPFYVYYFNVYVYTNSGVELSNTFDNLKHVSNIKKYWNINNNYFKKEYEDNTFDVLANAAREFLVDQSADALNYCDEHPDDEACFFIEWMLDNYFELVREYNEEENSMSTISQGRSDLFTKEIKDIAIDFLNNWTPQTIFNAIDKYVYKQDNAKKSATMVLWNHMQKLAYPEKNFTKNNYLMVGPTGCGKTEITRALKEISPVPVITVDCGNLTGTGWKGVNISQAFEAEITALTGKSIEQLNSSQKQWIDNGIYVMDEVDKILAGQGSDDMGFALCKQTSLLKLLEDGKVIHEKHGYVICNLKNATFILAGAFSGMFKNDEFSVGIDVDRKENNTTFDIMDISKMMIDYGMIPELAGRISNLILLNKLSSSDFYYILKNYDSSVVKEYIERLALDGVELNFTDETLREAAKIAYERNLGVRGANSLLRSVLNDVLFDTISRGKKHFKVTKTLLKNAKISYL